MKAQSVRAQEEPTEFEKDVQEQGSPAQTRENVAATKATTSTDATIQLLMDQIAQLTAQLNTIRALGSEQSNRQHQTDEDTLGQRQTNSPSSNALDQQRVAAAGPSGNDHRGQGGENFAGSEHNPA